MSREFDSSPLEDRLRTEAAQLALQHARRGSASSLQAEYGRRRRRQRRRVSALAAVVVLLAVGAVWSWVQDRGPVEHRATIADAPPQRSAAAITRPVAPPQEVAELDQSPIETPSTSPPDWQSILPEGAIAFLVTDASEPTPRVVGVGVYVPPRVERMHLRELPPLERSAVQQVLGLEDPFAKPTI